MLHILAQMPPVQPNDDFSSWAKGGVLTVILGLFVWLLTRYGPNALKEFREDVNALAESSRVHVKELVDGFRKDLAERDAKHAMECNAYRDLITEMSDKFTSRLEENERRVSELLRQQDERCRQDRERDWERFKEIIARGQ